MKKERERPRRVAQVKPYANNLRLCIRRCGYKAQEVADGIGMSRNTLSDYIVGNRPAPKDCLRKIADFIGCDIEDFAYKQSIGEVSAGSAMQQATDHQRQTDVALTAPLIPERPRGRDDKTSHGQAPRTGKGHIILTRETHRPALDGVWMCSFPNRAEHPAGTTSPDSAIWFGLKLAQLMTVIMNWAKEAICYDVLQAIIDQEINMFDAIKLQYPLQDYTVSRRQALVAIAALPMALLTAVYQRGESAIVMGEFLSRCAASLAACRHLINGRELGVVEQVLPQYLPTLAMLAQRSSPHQQAATELVIQAYHLQSILALHGNNFAAMERYRREALNYSRLTGDHTQLVGALHELARGLVDPTTGQRPLDALQALQEALLHLDKVPPILQSGVYARLAWVHAQCKQEQEALRYQGLAREAFFEQPPDSSIPHFVDYGIVNLYLCEGRTFSDLAQHYPDREYSQKAWNSFAEVENLPTTVIIPERIRIEVINYQALTALILGDVEQFCDLLQQGINGAKMLGSQKRRQEAIDAYWKGRGQWPNEARVRDLADLFVN